MSRLTKITLTNFMSLPNAILEFDETGIISPVGYNDSGKSAITRAMEVLWFDSYPQLQSKFITDNKPYFIIANYFDDGVLIQRTKYANGSNHWLMKQGDAEIYTNQLANGSFASTKGVPEVIQKYLGVAQDDATGEILNIRRNTNKLLLVSTTGGENYKIFNNLCQGERLAYAVATLNTDVNTKNRELTAKQSRLLGKKESLAGMQVFDEATEQNLLKVGTALDAATKQLQSLIGITQYYNQFAEREVIPEIPVLDVSKLDALMHIKQTWTDTQINIADSIPLVDTARLEMLEQLKTSAAALNQRVIENIPEVNTSAIEALGIIKTAFDKLQSAQAALGALEKRYTDLRQTLVAEAAANNWRICKNCGEIVTAEGGIS